MKSLCFEKIVQTIDQRTRTSFGYIHFFLEDVTLLCLKIAEKEQLDCQDFCWNFCRLTLCDAGSEKCLKFCGENN